jgi:dihydrodipicolinate synthase/N-acetylneuraminate lyase
MTQLRCLFSPMAGRLHIVDIEHHAGTLSDDFFELHAGTVAARAIFATSTCAADSFTFERSPAALKYALCLLGYMSPNTRLPIAELADSVKVEVASAIAEIRDEDLACPRESYHGHRLH